MYSRHCIVIHGHVFIIIIDNNYINLFINFHPIVDSSIVYFAQLFYLEKELNHWHMKFVVVKHLEAFAQVMKLYHYTVLILIVL